MLDRCANPECCQPFDHKEGRYFRFRRPYDGARGPANTHSVEHYWLCGRCSGIYSLQYQPLRGVVITLQLAALWRSFQPRIIRAA